MQISKRQIWGGAIIIGRVTKTFPQRRSHLTKDLEKKKAWASLPPEKKHSRQKEQKCRAGRQVHA